MLPLDQVPKVDPSTINLLIGTPCYGGVSHVAYNRAIRALLALLREHKVRHQILESTSESLIPRARNVYGNVTAWDSSPDGDHYTHLLFVDADICFNPVNVIQMLGWNKDVVALPYPCKSINWNNIVDAVRIGITEPGLLSRMGSRPIVNTSGTGISFNVSEPVKFPQLGTGILLIKREVFLKFAEDPKRKYRLMEGEKFYGARDWAYDFFQSGINSALPFDQRYYDSEDYRFCIDANALGFETWLLPWAVTSHTGNYEFVMDLPAQTVYGIPKPKDKVPAGFAPLTI